MQPQNPLQQTPLNPSDDTPNTTQSQPPLQTTYTTPDQQTEPTPLITPSFAQPSTPVTSFDPTTDSITTQPTQIITPTPASQPMSAPSVPGTMTAMQSPAFMPPTSTPTKSRRSLILALSIGVGAMLILAGVLFYVFIIKRVTPQDVKNAQTTMSAMISDVSDSTDALASAADTQTIDDARSNLNTAQHKLADAEKQFTALQKSPTLNDNNTEQKFQLFAKKWTPLASFLQNSINDSNNLLPITITFQSTSNQLDQTTPDSVAALNAYIGQYKTTVNNTMTQLKNSKQTLSENQEAVSELQTFLGSVSDSLGTAQSDLASGDLYKVSSDLLKIDDAHNTFTTSNNAIQTKLADHVSQLSTSSERFDFQSALDTLSTKTK